MMILKIGAIEVLTLAALKLEQTYEPIKSGGIFRTYSGAGLKMSTWKRTRISTSGSGWMPAGLDAIDTDVQHVLACVTPRQVSANLATRQATLPAARRSDGGHTPWGQAIMPDGSTVRTDAVMAGNVATLGAVDGAVAYVALYLPQYTVWVEEPSDAGNRDDATYTWQLVCEQV